MSSFKSAIKLFIVLIILVAAATISIVYYPWVFSKRVKGEIMGVERVTESTAILSARVTDAQMHSYSILIRGEDGKLFTTSSEDAQWQVAKVGYCVEARLFRNPPWAINKANTFFNARILELSLCKGRAAPTYDNPVVPAPAEAPAAAPAEPTAPPAVPGQ